MKKLILFWTLILGLVLSLQQNILACSCSGYPSVCQAYDSADLIVMGKVKKIDNFSVIHFQVDKTFKGNSLKEIVVSDEDTSCSQYFKEGERWLLYAKFDQKTKTWMAPQCGRSHRFNSISSYDVNYLKNVGQRQGKTFLSGNVSQSGKDEVQINEFVEGLKVKIVGKTQTFETKTDKFGYYEFFDFPTDLYKISPQIPQDLVLGNYYLSGFNTFYLDTVLSGNKYVLNNFKEQRCVGVDFTYAAKK